MVVDINLFSVFSDTFPECLFAREHAVQGRYTTFRIDKYNKYMELCLQLGQAVPGRYIRLSYYTFMERLLVGEYAVKGKYTSTTLIYTHGMFA